MSEKKKYSLDEIDEMRALLWRLNAWTGKVIDRNFDAAIEDRLRTLMANGTAVEELRQKHLEIEQEEERRQTEKHEWMLSLAAKAETCRACGGVRVSMSDCSETDDEQRSRYGVRVVYSCGGTAFVVGDTKGGDYPDGVVRRQCGHSKFSRFDPSRWTGRRA